ncbi:Glutamyl-tRNA(Gln) amidotransferase subunit C, chloroplastic/mitochondrial [Melia azedarach]|uniref:Glutamyl-tRNA(Gln) amidotransferase subunit C, chloroplastic/mitochondrial n=1 Tax=Melia azedarach TaxID=155640 RepID=A0ACC1XAM5_MELAZ|nr:Glutamyl-tRNA(Gln) amidotransferase subunit C, chloroplastic/mitochondrial [Melia azedarach]
MGSRGLLLLKGATPKHQILNFGRTTAFTPKLPIYFHHKLCNYSTTTRSSLEPPDVPRLAETARISLTPTEVEEFAPKIRQVIGWFGQLQAVDLNSVDPAIRADTETDNVRDDTPETFNNREAVIAAIPSYEEPYIKVPKVLNKE